MALYVPASVAWPPALSLGTIPEGLGLPSQLQAEPPEQISPHCAAGQRHCGLSLAKSICVASAKGLSHCVLRRLAFRHSPLPTLCSKTLTHQSLAFPSQAWAPIYLSPHLCSVATDLKATGTIS